MDTEYRSAAILSGGKSSRFGSNKALAPWKNEGLLIEAVANSVKKTVDELFIVANHSKFYLSLGLDIIPDEFPGKGPLAGIHTALKHSRGFRVFIVACDMPFVSPELIDKMWHIKTWAPVVVPEHDKGLEPLHAIYHKSLIPLIENQIKKGRLSLLGLLEEIPFYSLNEKEISFFSNINTKEDMEHIKLHCL